MQMFMPYQLDGPPRKFFMLPPLPVIPPFTNDPILMFPPTISLWWGSFPSFSSLSWAISGIWFPERSSPSLWSRGRFLFSFTLPAATLTLGTEWCLIFRSALSVLYASTYSKIHSHNVSGRHEWNLIGTAPSYIVSNKTCFYYLIT